MTKKHIFRPISGLFKTHIIPSKNIIQRLGVFSDVLRACNRGRCVGHFSASSLYPVQQRGK